MARNKIRDSIIEQLERRGANIPALQDLVDRYIYLGTVADKLQADIDARGVTYQDFSSVGVEIWKHNPSVAELNRITGQMAKLLQQLKISPDTIAPDDDGDDVL